MVACVFALRSFGMVGSGQFWQKPGNGHMLPGRVGRQPEFTTILCLAVPILPRERKVRSCRCINGAASRLRQRVMHVAGRCQRTPYGKSLAPGTLHGLRSSATSSEPCCMNMDLLLVMKVSSIDLKEMCCLLAVLVHESWPPMAWNLANSSSQLTPMTPWAAC